MLVVDKEELYTFVVENGVVKGPTHNRDPRLHQWFPVIDSEPVERDIGVHPYPELSVLLLEHWNVARLKSFFLGALDTKFSIRTRAGFARLFERAYGNICPETRNAFTTQIIQATFEPFHDLEHSPLNKIREATAILQQIILQTRPPPP